jgi:hypothetical protein
MPEDDDIEKKIKRLEMIKRSMRFDEAIASSSILLCQATRNEIEELDLEILVRRVKNTVNRRIAEGLLK